MKATYDIITENGTKTVIADYEVNNGCLTSFEGEVAFVPTSKEISRIADAVYTNGTEVHCAYFAQGYCDEREINYEEVNSHFFALIRYADKCRFDFEKNRIVLKIYGVTDAEEFEDLYVDYGDGLRCIKKVFFNEGPSHFGPGLIYDLTGVESLYLPPTVLHVSEKAFAQRYCVIPCLENINVIQPEPEPSDDFYYSIDGILYYYNYNDFFAEDCDELIKFPAGKKEPCFDIPVPMHSDFVYVGENAFKDAFFVNSISINTTCQIHTGAFNRVPNLKLVAFRGDGNYSGFDYSRRYIPGNYPTTFEVECSVYADRIIDHCVNWHIPLSFEKE